MRQDLVILKDLFLDSDHKSQLDATSSSEELVTDYTVGPNLWDRDLFITSDLHMISDSLFESDQMPLLPRIHTWEHYLIVQVGFHRFQDCLLEH